MLRIKNTALEPSKALQIRTATKLEMEPMINGQRLRLRSSMDISEEWANKNRDFLERLVKNGVIEVSYSDKVPPEPKLNDEGLKLGGPTLEQFMKAGYPADMYPPSGWAVVPSAGLTAYQKQKAEADAAAVEAAHAAEAAKAKAEAEALESAKKMREAQEALAAEQIAPVEVVSPIEQAAEEAPPAPVSESAGAPQDSAAEEQTEQKRGPGRPKKKLF